MADEPKSGAEGADGAEDRGTEERKSEIAERSGTVFDELRGKLAKGERLFPPKGEATADAEEKPAKGEEAAAEAGAEDGAAVEDEGGEAADEEAGADAGDGADGGDGADDEIVVELPGRREGETVQFVVSSEAEAEDLRRLSNMAMRREAVNEALARVQEREDEQDEIDTALAVDPAGFLLSRVSKEHRVALTRALLLDDDVFSALHADEELGLELAQGADREKLRLRSESERRKAADQASADVQALRHAKEQVRQNVTDLESLVPAKMDEAQRDRFMRASLGALKEATARLGKYLNRDEIIQTLQHEGLLDRFGVDPGAAPAGRKPAASTRREAAAAAAGGKPAASGKDASSTPESLRKARARRKSVAGTASAGAGAPPASIELPRHASVKDRVDFARKHGLGNVLSGKAGKG